MRTMQPVEHEHFVSWNQPPEQMDALWELGWRHFGPIFYRYREAWTNEGLRHVRPLRIDVAKFAPSKSQRRALRLNADLEVRVQPVLIDAERVRLFDIHKLRFKDNIPNSLEDFLGPAPQVGPCQTVEVAGYLGSRLIAASYLDVGMTGVSSIYAFFDPEFEDRRLGIATMLWELLFAKSTGKTWHYPGYCYDEPSGYDYKKRFQPMYYYDWHGWENQALPVEGA